MSKTKIKGKTPLLPRRRKSGDVSTAKPFESSRASSTTSTTPTNTPSTSTRLPSALHAGHFHYIHDQLKTCRLDGTQPHGDPIRSEARLVHGMLKALDNGANGLPAAYRHEAEQ